MTAEEMPGGAPRVEAGAPPAVPAAPPEIPRRFPVARVLLGLVLVAGAVAVVLWPRGLQLKADWRLAADEVAPGNKAVEIDAVHAGESAVLGVTVKAGPQAPEGARLVCNAQSRPRILVMAPAGISFERTRGFAHDVEDEIPMRFSVEKSMPPGRHELDLYVEAELAVDGSAVVRTAALRTRIPVEVRPPLPPKEKAGR